MSSQTQLQRRRPMSPITKSTSTPSPVQTPSQAQALQISQLLQQSGVHFVHIPNGIPVSQVEQALLLSNSGHPSDRAAKRQMVRKHMHRDIFTMCSSNHYMAAQILEEAEAALPQQEMLFKERYLAKRDGTSAGAGLSTTITMLIENRNNINNNVNNNNVNNNQNKNGSVSTYPSSILSFKSTLNSTSTHPSILMPSKVPVMDDTASVLSSSSRMSTHSRASSLFSETSTTSTEFSHLDDTDYMVKPIIAAISRSNQQQEAGEKELLGLANSADMLISVESSSINKVQELNLVHPGDEAAQQGQDSNTSNIHPILPLSIKHKSAPVLSLDTDLPCEEDDNDDFSEPNTAVLNLISATPTTASTLKPTSFATPTTSTATEEEEQEDISNQAFTYLTTHPPRPSSPVFEIDDDVPLSISLGLELASTAAATVSVAATHGSLKRRNRNSYTSNTSYRNRSSYSGGSNRSSYSSSSGGSNRAGFQRTKSVKLQVKTDESLARARRKFGRGVPAALLQQQPPQINNTNNQKEEEEELQQQQQDKRRSVVLVDTSVAQLELDHHIQVQQRIQYQQDLKQKIQQNRPILTVETSSASKKKEAAVVIQQQQQPQLGFSQAKQQQQPQYLSRPKQQQQQQQRHLQRQLHLSNDVWAARGAAYMVAANKARIELMMIK